MEANGTRLLSKLKDGSAWMHYALQPLFERRSSMTTQRAKAAHMTN